MPPEALAQGPSRLFDYVARRMDGSEVLGRATADGELELDRRLQQDGLTLIRSKPFKPGAGIESLRMPRQDLLAFTSQLATMIQAGLPLLQSLQHLAKHSRSKAAGRIIQSILRQIEGGSSLSMAFASHPAVFPDTYVAMVRSGEMSGGLPEVLRKQGKFLEWVREIKATTKQALIYPTALCVAILGLIVILVTFLIPRLVGLFPGGHDDLPSQTKFVLAISDFVIGQWPTLVLGLVAAGVGFAVLLRTPRTRVVLSHLLLRIPRLGNLMRMLAVARFCTTASALHSSGCEIVKTLQIAGDSCGNSYMRGCFGRVIEAVRGGETISEGMRRVGDLDPYLVQLTTVGEASGRLGESLEYLADSYNTEVPRAVKWGLGLIEPVILIVGGVVVAFLLLAAILPIFKIYETLG
jgi:type II secretory pathway component PulF